MCEVFYHPTPLPLLMVRALKQIFFYSLFPEKKTDDADCVQMDRYLVKI